MKGEERNLPIEFQIAGIETEQFAVMEEAYKQGEDVGLNIGLQFSVHSEHKGIGVHFNLQFRHKEAIFIQLKTVCFFEIMVDNWDSLLEDDEKKIKLPKGFASHLSVITVGTTRGVLYEKLRNLPPFDQFILPTINVSKILEEDVLLDIQ